MSKADYIREVLRYVDLTLDVDVEPDSNHCCWIAVNGYAVAGSYTSMRFDITEEEVDLFIAALQEFKANLAKEREGEECT